MPGKRCVRSSAQSVHSTAENGADSLSPGRRGLRRTAPGSLLRPRDPTLGIMDASSGAGNSFLEDLLWGYRPHTCLQKLSEKKRVKPRTFTGP